MAGRGSLADRHNGGHRPGRGHSRGGGRAGQGDRSGRAGRGHHRPEDAGCGEPSVPPPSPSPLTTWRPFPSGGPHISWQVSSLPARRPSPRPPPLRATPSPPTSGPPAPPAPHLGAPGRGLWAVDAPNRLWDPQLLPRGRRAGPGSRGSEGTGRGRGGRPEVKGPAHRAGFRGRTDRGLPGAVRARPRRGVRGAAELRGAQRGQRARSPRPPRPLGAPPQASGPRPQGPPLLHPPMPAGSKVRGAPPRLGRAPGGSAPWRPAALRGVPRRLGLALAL